MFNRISCVAFCQNRNTSMSFSKRTTVSDQMKLVQSVDSLFQTIHSIFLSGEMIKQVLIVLGSSIMSPRDCYLFSFPTEFYEGRTLSRQSCLSRLFRTLYVEDFLAKSKPLNSCTNLFVMFLVPRQCDHRRWNLTPRLSYKVPFIGTHYGVNIIFEGDNVMQSNPTLNLVGDELDISGIQPLDKSGNDLSLYAQTPVKSPKRSVCDDDDYVWFELPVVVKGYKEKL